VAYPYDLGTYSRQVTTGSAEAQTWFDRGLNWTFGYNHEEAVRCFQRAAEADPDCAHGVVGSLLRRRPELQHAVVADGPRWAGVGIAGGAGCGAQGDGVARSG
jgi:hypothetical protein